MVSKAGTALKAWPYFLT